MLLARQISGIEKPLDKKVNIYPKPQTAAGGAENVQCLAPSRRFFCSHKPFGTLNLIN